MTTTTGRADPAVSRSDEPGRRSELRSVALPSEHGGWGLTVEPGLLGLLLAPGPAGAALAVAALGAFCARTPLRVVLVDLRRGRRLRRTVVAAAVLAVEVAVVAVLAALAVARAGPVVLVPIALAAPLVALELWFDMRSRSRRLVPELAGSVGICSVAAAVVLAGGGSWELAAGAWLLLAARAVTSIPWVRSRIAILHGQLVNRTQLAVTDLAALGAAGAAVVLEQALAAGALAVVAVVGVQRFLSTRPVPAPKVIGFTQMGLGLAVVAAAAAGAGFG